jgi:hypothetical protein
VLLLQHPVLVLVFKLKLCCSLVRWLGSVFFFFCLSVAAAWSAPPSVRCGSLSLTVSLQLQNQLCSPPAVLLWSWVFTVLVYWELVSLPHPLSLGQGQWSFSRPLLSECCDGLLFVFQFCGAIWLWILLTSSGDELCGSLAALLQAVAYHLPTLGLSAFQPLFAESKNWKETLAPCSPLPFCCALSVFLPPLLCVSFQFIVYCFFVFFFLARGDQSAQGAMLVYPRVAGGIPCDTWHSPVCFAKCLPSWFGVGI